MLWHDNRRITALAACRPRRVIALNRSSLSIVSTLALGGKPRRIAFDFNGSTAVVADETGAVHR